MQGRHPKGQLRPLLPPDTLRLTKRWVCGLMTQRQSATAPPWHPPHSPPAHKPWPKGGDKHLPIQGRVLLALTLLPSAKEVPQKLMWLEFPGRERKKE